jgi:hypothetical protein
MQSRFLKQLIYGSLYLAVIFGLAFLAYILILRPAPSCFDNRRNQGEKGIDCGGPCQPCEIKDLNPVSVLGTPQILPVDGKTSVFVQLKNPNSGYGAEFSYVLNLYGSDDLVVYSVTGDSYIYAGQIKPWIEALLPIDFKKVGRGEFSIKNVNWRSREEFSDPTLTVRAVKTTSGADEARITGLAVNSNSYKVSRASLIGVVYDELGFRIAVSKTLLQDILPFEERAFTIVLRPGGKAADFRKTEVFVEAKR